MPTDRPIVFYDGGCPICRREINHYRRLPGADAIEWLDIDTNLQRVADYGLSRDRVMRYLHLLEPDGQPRVGIDAFAGIWSRLARYRWLARLTRWPLLARLMRFFYELFAAWRWRRVDTCTTDRCAVPRGGRELDPPQAAACPTQGTER